MPLESTTANPSNSKNGIALSTAKFDETDTNKIDDDSSLSSDNTDSDTPLDNSIPSEYDPESILDSVESGETFKPTKTSGKKDTKVEEQPLKPEDNKEVDTDKDNEVSEETDKTDTAKEEDKEEKEVEIEKEVVTDDKKKKEFPEGERDLTDFTDEEKRLLKKCDNRAFSVLSAKIKEHKTNYEKAEAARLELHKIVNEKAIPLEFYQHPDAYTLTDDYKELANNFSLVQREREHFRSQLLKIKKGEQWVDLKGWGKNGNPVYSEPQEPNEEAALDLQERISEAANIQGTIQGQVGALAAHFKERHETDTKAIVSAVEGYVAKLHEGFKPEQKHIDAAISMLPKSKRSDPLARSVALCYGVIAKLAMALENKKSIEKTQALKNNDDKDAGVKTTGLSKGGSRSSNNSNGGHINFKGRMIPAEYDPASFKRGDDE